MELSVLENFSEYPGLRHCDISDDSGEMFYHEKLNDAFHSALEAKEKLVIELDYTSGYAPSFLDEAFGNLVYDFTLKVVKDNIDIISIQEPNWREMIYDETFPEWEKRRNDDDAPKKTIAHNSWWRLVNGEYIKEVWISL